MFRFLTDPVLNRYYQVKDYIQEKKCVFSEEELTEYQSYTFLSKRQIKRVYWLFESLHSEEDPFEIDRNPAVPKEKILQMQAFHVNPFKDRIVKVFCENEDTTRFEEFLEMMSVFCDKAHKSVKAEYAFKIYDFNDDDMICHDDLEELLRRLEGINRFTAIDIEEMIENVMAEGDLDADGFITYKEFKHVIKKCPDFVHSFRMRV